MIRSFSALATRLHFQKLKDTGCTSDEPREGDERNKSFYVNSIILLHAVVIKKTTEKEH